MSSLDLGGKWRIDGTRNKCCVRTGIWKIWGKNTMRFLKIKDKYIKEKMKSILYTISVSEKATVTNIIGKIPKKKIILKDMSVYN